MPSSRTETDLPDTGVVTSYLYMYSGPSGNGGLIAVLHPQELPARAVRFVKTEELEIAFELNREANTAEVTLTRLDGEPSKDHSVHKLTPEFQTEQKVSLSVLFSNWQIIAVVDGEPLPKIQRS